ncbi:MAG: hypothetical protein ACLU06_00065 [Eggerthellaceae bacterium]
MEKRERKQSILTSLLGFAVVIASMMVFLLALYLITIVIRFLFTLG